MSTDLTNRADAERRLWDEIEKHNTGMLGVTRGAAHHTQPMTAFVERKTNQLWFFTRTDTDLAREIAEGKTAMFVHQQRDFQACIGGQLTLQHDTDRINKYWNSVVAAWYPDGKDDPKLTMLCLDCDDAQVWISEGGPVKFVWEIAKANATHTTPSVGSSTSVNFH